jgi:phospholipid N-methyltransferase
MGRAGVFVQFTYGFGSPIPRDVCANRYWAHCGRPIWRNLPPARVWTYRLAVDAGGGESAALGRAANESREA